MKLTNNLAGNGAIYIPKGRNRIPVTDFLVDRGIKTPPFPERLLTAYNESGRRFGLRRGSDIPSIMARQAVSALGFMGSDKWAELPGVTTEQLTFEPVMPTGASLVLATAVDRVSEIEARIKRGDEVVVATSYPITAKETAADLGFDITVIRYNGAVEGSLRDGLDVDAILDVKEFGRTLTANGMESFRELGRVNIGAVYLNT